MQRYARRRVRSLAPENLSGYVLKKDSPSCGMERVKVWHAQGRANERKGRGLFAAELMRQYPNLPRRGGRPPARPANMRENFFDRVFMYRRVRCLFSARWTVGRLVAFHTAHKLTLMAHSGRGYRELGRLVADAKRIPRAELARRYEDELMSAGRNAGHAGLGIPTPCSTRLGHFKRTLDPDSRNELSSIIEDYRLGLVPRVVPLTLIRHHARRLDVPYLLEQRYLDPELKELMLRNHV